MAIISDGSQSFAIDASPITIDAVTYVAEAMIFNFTANRVDINDSNGEPLGSKVIPGRLEGTATLQLAADTTATNVRGKEFTLDVANNDIDGTYLIVDCSEAQSQGDYVKLSINFYKKLN